MMEDLYALWGLPSPERDEPEAKFFTEQVDKAVPRTRRPINVGRRYYRCKGKSENARERRRLG